MPPKRRYPVSGGAAARRRQGFGRDSPSAKGVPARIFNGALQHAQHSGIMHGETFEYGGHTFIREKDTGPVLKIRVVK